MTTETKPKALLDTAVAESLWTGGQGTAWIERVVNGEVEASLCASSVVELFQKAPDRRAEIRLAALVSVVAPIELNVDIARRAGGIARDLDSDDPALIPSAIVAAAALELQIPVACVDEDFFSAMGCEIAD